ncbi:UNKNOWN [Stylonychia lemnae]|uniref:Uncharacterized protein n=1 Tax=Stylonychia lemnae TaxID=5949 RepID=A0A078A0J5_STYLE|nr:UNKNOWN [Stylonychia lemnae]|eukprot:CDW75372.1 UNKNOWN [Stylonychia lemnae]
MRSQNSQNEERQEVEEFDRVTFESNLAHLTPNQYLESKFYKNGVHKNNEDLNIVSTFHEQMRANSNSSKGQKGKFLKKMSHRKKDTSQSQRPVIQPSLVQLNASGPKDYFNRSGLLYFQPKKHGTNLECFNAEEANSSEATLSFRGFESYRQSQDNRSPPKKIIIHQQTHPNQLHHLKNQSPQKIKSQIRSSHVNESQPNNNINNVTNLNKLFQGRFNYRRLVKNKRYQQSSKQQQSTVKGIVNQSMDNYTLQQYLSPIKQHYRIVYKDGREHQEQQKHLRNNFDYQGGFDSNEEEQIQKNKLQLGKSNLDDCKMFVKMLKEYRDRKVELFSHQIKNQSRDIDYIFRNKNHNDPQTISMREVAQTNEKSNQVFNSMLSLQALSNDDSDSPRNKQQRVISQIAQTQGMNSNQLKNFQLQNQQQRQLYHQKVTFRIQQPPDIQEQILQNQAIINREIQLKEPKHILKLPNTPTLKNTQITSQTPKLGTKMNDSPLNSSFNPRQFINKNIVVKSLNGSQTNIETPFQDQCLIKKKRRDRLNFEREKVLAMAVPGYIDYVYDF